MDTAQDYHVKNVHEIRKEYERKNWNEQRKKTIIEGEHPGAGAPDSTMADQRFWKQTSTFLLDLHGVAHSDAVHAIRNRMRECLKYGIRHLQIVFGTPHRYQGSIAEALHEILGSGAPIDPSSVPPEFWTSPEEFARRQGFVRCSLARYLGDVGGMDERSSFKAFTARYETDPWKKNLCENPYQPLRVWYSVEDVARRLGGQCTPFDVRRMASGEDPDLIRQADSGEITHVHCDLLPWLVYRWAGKVKPRPGKRRSRGGRWSGPNNEADSRQQELLPGGSANSERAELSSTGAGTGLDGKESWSELLAQGNAGKDGHRAVSRGDAAPEGSVPQPSPQDANCLKNARDKFDANSANQSLRPSRHEWMLAIQEGIVKVEGGQYEQAIDNFAHALDISTGLGWREQYVSVSNLGYVYDLMGDSIEACQWYEEALKLARNNTTPDHPFVQCAEWNLKSARGEQVSPAVFRPDKSERPDAAARLAEVLRCFRRAEEHYAYSDFAAALQLAEAGLAVSSGMIPDTHTIRVGLGMLRSLSLRYLNRLEAAEEGFRGLLSLQLQHSDPLRALALTHLGTCLRLQGRYGEAVEAHQQAISILENSSDGLSWITSLAWLNLGVALRFREDLPRAEEAYLNCLKMEREISESPTTQGAGAMANLGMLYLATSKLREAEQMLREALEIQRRLLPPDHLDIAHTAFGLGQVLMEFRRFKDAIELLEMAARIRSQKLGLTHPSTLRAAMALKACRQLRKQRF